MAKRYTEIGVPLFNRKSCALLALAAITLLFSCSRAPSEKVSAKTSSRKSAPDFTLTDADGKQVKLSDYRGKVVLLNFWATWCGPCAIEIPWFEQFEQQYKSKGFEVLGVSMDEDGWKAIKPYVAARKVNYRILLGNDFVTQLYGGVESLPTTFMIDRNGRIAYPPHVGLAEKNEYLNEIQDLLGIKPTSAANRVVRLVPAGLIARATK